MNGLKLSLKIFGILFLLFGAAFASLSITNYTTSQSSFKTGGQGYITLTVTNPSTSSSEGMTAVLATITAPPELMMSSSENVGDLEPSASAVVTLPFKIKNNSKSGFYNVVVKLSGYTKSTSSTTPSFYSTSISVPIIIMDLPIFSVESNPSILSALDEVEFTILNNGGPAGDATLRLGNSSKIALYGTNQIFIGEISKSAKITAQLDARSATDGPVDMPVIISYHDELGNDRTDSVSVRVTVKKHSLDLVFTQVGKVITRKEGDLTLNVRNNGNKNIEDLQIHFTNTSIKLKDKEKLSYGDVAAGADATATATVFADYKPGLNRIGARVVWTEDNVEREEEIEIPITLTSDADVGVYIETKPAPISAGQEQTLSVLVSNLGSYAIGNVEVQIESDAFETLDISNKQYIGNLESDDFSTVQFKTKVPANTAIGEHKMNITVRYRDQSGEWETRTIEQPLSIHPAVQGNGSFIFYLVGAVIVIALAWYFFIRKKKLQVPGRQ